MGEEQGKLILGQTNKLVRGSWHPNSIIGRMTRDALHATEAIKLSNELFRIGEYLLRAPDFRQIQWWASELGMPPEQVLEVLEKAVIEGEKLGLVVENGSVLSIVWDFTCFPIVPSYWEPGLAINTLSFKGVCPETGEPFSPDLPHLDLLFCGCTGLKELNLSGTPNLVTLFCHQNQLTKLDLTTVPLLSILFCHGNKLTDLGLTSVPGLTKS